MSQDLLNSFKLFFSEYSPSKFASLADIYAADIHFVDPITDIRGLDALTHHLNTTAEGLIFCKFDFLSEVIFEKRASLEWVMTYAHPKLASGARCTLFGNTVIEFNNDQRIAYHRDYYDMGEMVYEHIPLLGRCIKYIKHRLTA